MTPRDAMSQGNPVTDLPAVPSSAPLLSVDGAVATLTLNRPAHRNRLEGGDLHALLAAFGQINADPAIRVLVLTANTRGQPRPVFCAGFDIGGFSEQDSDPRLFERVANALAAVRPITVCALNGSVYGGATDLMLACDFSVGLSGTEFRMPATALGLHYYPGGLQRYVARLGLSGAKRAFLSARPFSAELLQQMGCFEALVGPDAFDATVRQLVSDIAALAPLAVQATKQSINEITAGQPDLAAMRDREAISAGSRDFAEGRRAFQEKRKPRFTGS
jgi:enoyl-CoA hydratase/carnithine racemase